MSFTVPMISSLTTVPRCCGSRTTHRPSVLRLEMASSSIPLATTRRWRWCCTVLIGRDRGWDLMRLLLLLAMDTPSPMSLPKRWIRPLMELKMAWNAWRSNPSWRYSSVPYPFLSYQSSCGSCAVPRLWPLRATLALAQRPASLLLRFEAIRMTWTTSIVGGSLSRVLYLCWCWWIYCRASARSPILRLFGASILDRWCILLE
mmetsp:Transcript_27955/g.80782  ORF Transcript_27955/g.80782 Transcript_27955/m.80782 type:complete len:203 (+) Transcript_27955:1009-1617(+)